MDNSEDEIEEEIYDHAKKLFLKDHPDGNFGVMARPKMPWHPSGKQANEKDEKKYKKMARIELGYEGDE